ncbi:MAG TPA: metal ABC transporter ATP-binding protein [Pseudogracilibacillus sp.]|nr:metal ABC transporter ATP-binding protein [Pseudogracilibacillus sp.]
MAIEVQHMHVSYGGKKVVEDVGFSFDTGKLIGIIGPNGAGKSTLMKAILGLIPRDYGSVSFDGKSIKQVRQNIAYLPQRSAIDWDFPILVRDAVLTGTYPKLGLFRRPGKKEKQLAHQCLEKVGMEDFRNSQIGELSGGQQQRVFLARALAQQAEFFFLDEPFVGIDVASEKVIIDILKSLRNEGKTIFVVHHDLSKIETYFDDLVLLNKELYGAGSVTNVYQPENMQKCYQMDLPFAQSMEVEG